MFVDNLIFQKLNMHVFECFDISYITNHFMMSHCCRKRSSEQVVWRGCRIMSSGQVVGNGQDVVGKGAGGKVVGGF